MDLVNEQDVALLEVGQDRGEVVIVDGPLADVREALLALGLSPPEASEAMAGLPANGDRSTEDLLRDALQRMGGTRADGAGVG